MTQKYDFDYLVIGSGLAGSAAAFGLARVGKNVGLVEMGKFGGSNLNTRNIPFAVGRDFSHLYFEASHRVETGLSGVGMHYNMPTLANWQKKVTRKAGGDDWKVYERAGIQCLAGRAHLIDAHTVAVNDKQYLVNKIILATGSQPINDTITGLSEVKYLTPEDAILMRKIPRAVVIVGGGASGCETAEFFAELGAKVLILEMADRILPKEDKDVSKTISDYFTNKLGVIIQTHAKVVALEKCGELKRIVFVNHGSEKVFKAENVVLAIGSRPMTDFGLENAGVKYNRAGIVVDKNFMTSARNIFAIGNAIGNGVTTEIATHQGFALVNSLLSKKEIELNYIGYPRTIKTFPEVTQIGFSEDDLKRRDRKYYVGVAKLSEVTAGKIYNFEDGFVKILGNGYGKIIGATIVAPGAELLMQELSMAMRNKISVLDIASTPHAENSYSLAVKLAARRLALKYSA